MKLTRGVLQQARVLRKDYAASRWWPNQDAVPTIDNSVSTFANGGLYMALQPFCEPIPNQVHRGKPWDPEPITAFPMSKTVPNNTVEGVGEWYTLGQDYGRFASGYAKIVRLVFAVYCFLKAKEFLTTGCIVMPPFAPPGGVAFNNTITAHQAADAQAAADRAGPALAQARLAYYGKEPAPITARVTGH